MRKIQFFIFVESILLTFALVTILSGHFSRVILFLVLFLLLLYYYFGKQRGNFLLVTSTILLFFIIMLNPYVIAALLFAVIYGMIVAYPYIYKENEATTLIFDDAMEQKRENNQWLGNLHHFRNLNGKMMLFLEQLLRMLLHNNIFFLESQSQHICADP